MSPLPQVRSASPGFGPGAGGQVRSLSDPIPPRYPKSLGWVLLAASHEEEEEQ